MFPKVSGKVGSNVRNPYRKVHLTNELKVNTKVILSLKTFANGDFLSTRMATAN